MMEIPWVIEMECYDSIGFLFFFDKLQTKAFNISKILYSMKNLGIWRIVFDW